MAFTQDTRNRLARFVTTARRLLADDFTRQLQNDYGLNPDSGDIADIATLDRLDDARRSTGVLLHDTAAHYLVSADQSTPAKAKKARQDALSRIVREQAFTLLNRLCALRMAEARGLLLESIAKAYESQAFQLYKMVAGPALGETGEAYRAFLFSIFDEFAVDLSVLFDRFSPTGRLFPKESTLLAVLDEINHPDLASLWGEDETIGWIYQYFNSIEERREMRAASSAPRNSRELAVRNQFFTPRYVVEFLTDNTLGRLWYEMTKGATRLVEKCRYLVKAAGDGTPALPDGRARTPAAPQSDSPRPLKDPREIRMLDPACGSMHFGLYAFDLFEVIYEEAWDLEEKLGGDAFARTDFAKSLHETYASREAFLLDVPRLILENNIHGVDIDPRATQIAGLSLWLRAQRAWKDRGVKPADRPQIRRANVVCAEPMPGEEDLLNDFADKLRPKVLGQLLKLIFQKMKLAGEAGSLLRIEEDIKSEIAEAHRAYLAAVEQEKADDGYLAGLAPKTQQLSLFDFSDLPKREDFWATAEQRLVAALRDYAEDAADNAGMKRLFAADAARGFALIDLLSKRYDVVVMNPPFGEAAENAVGYLENNYPTWSKNILCCFIIRALGLLCERGFSGAIFDRTAAVKVTYEDFRREFIIPHLKYIADTGWYVLDANVETTVHVYQENNVHEAIGFDVREFDSQNKSIELHRSICDSERVYKFTASELGHLPNAVVGYDFKHFLLKLFDQNPSLTDAGYQARKGHDLVSDCHFRLHHEVSVNASIAPNGKFVLFYNGGRYSTFAEPIRDVAMWGEAARYVRYHISVNFRNVEFNNLMGVGFGKRGEYLDAHVLPRSMTFSAEGLAATGMTDCESHTYLSYLNSSIAQYAINQYCGQHKHCGYVNLLPFPLKDRKVDDEAVEIAKRGYLLKSRWNRREETALSFDTAWEKYFAERGVTTLAAALDCVKGEYETDAAELDAIIAANDNLWFDRAGLTEADREIVRKGVAARPHDTPWLDAADEIQSAGFAAMFARRLISYAAGRVFGRFRGEVPALSEDLFEPPLNLRAWNLGSANFGSAPAILPMEERGAKSLTNGVLDELSKIFPEEDLAEKLAQVLGVRDFGEYMLSPNGFFDDHFKLYCKSRRIAPLYLPFTSASGTFTLWIYYQRLTSQTLYTCVNDFIDPRLALAKERVEHERMKPMRSAAEDETLDYEQTIVDELTDMRAQLLEQAKVWRPDLDDGVLMTLAPLWKFFRHRLFQTKLKEAWTAIENGEYEWTRQALVHWPERVVGACHHDHATAIAHDLEDRLWEEVEVTRRRRKVKEWRPQPLSAEEIAGIVQEVKTR